MTSPLTSWINIDNEVNSIESVLSGASVIVGWGASGIFKTLYDYLGIKVDVLIDSNPEVQGKTVAKMVVHPPEILHSFPRGTVVLIYSTFSDEIGKICDSIGLRYLSVLSFSHINKQSIAFGKVSRDKPNPVNGVIRNTSWVVQGPWRNGVTDVLLELLHSSGTVEQIIYVGALPKEVRYRPSPNVFVLDPSPQLKPGYQNRNLQIKSTKLGLEFLANYVTREDIVVKCRSDLVPYKIFHIMALLSGISEVKSFVAERVIISSVFTRRNIPFHFSDMFMLGMLKDMQDFWCVDYDPRDLSQADFDQKPEQLGLLGIPAESYLGLNYARKLRDYPLSMSGYESLLVKKFLVLDPQVFGLVWYKNPLLLEPGIPVMPGFELITAADWLALARQNGIKVPRAIRGLVKVPNFA